jgi:pantoate--beta-alanine ligase
MILFKKAIDLHKWLDAQRKKGNSIGFAPTMGALHPGHISLIQNSKTGNKVTISSIFVNPTQFNDPKDFEKYPITLEKDIPLLEAAGCDVLFLPSVKEMYPDGLQQANHYDLGFLETVFDGKFRSGHFQGVCMVVHRLLEIVQPDKLYLGQKDYQQCTVITKLIELIKLDDTIKVIVCPTLREKDGLAMSSRNMRLNVDERQKAVTIFQSLSFIKKNLRQGDTHELIAKARKMLEDEGFKIDYVEIADAKTLSTVSAWDGKQKLVVLAAAFLNEVRLIDNMLLP